MYGETKLCVPGINLWSGNPCTIHLWATLKQGNEIVSRVLRLFVFMGLFLTDFKKDEVLNSTVFF